MKLIPANVTDYLFIFLFLSVAVLISFYYYRNSKLSSNLKAILISLRTLSLFLLLFIVLNPFYSYLFQDRKPVNVFLVDKSLSLNTGGRINDLKSTVNSFINDNGFSESDNMYFVFGEDLEITPKDKYHLFSDSAEARGYSSTNISRSINTMNKILSGKKIKSVIIFSDGIINDGGNGIKDAVETNAPYFYAIPGDTARKKDLSVQSLLFNKTVTAGIRTTISAIINSYGFENKIKVNLFENNTLINSKPLDVFKNVNLYNLDFEVINNNASINKYKVEIEPDGEELTSLNNSEECFIKFSKHTFKAIIISGSPSADFAFFSETLRKIKEYQTDFFTQKSQGQFYEGNNPGYKDADFIILFGYPTGISDMSFTKNMLDEAINSNKPVIFFDASGTSYEYLKAYEHVLPFAMNNVIPQEIETSIKPVLKPDNNSYFPSDFYSKTGYTVFKSLHNFDVKPGAESVLFSVRDSEPLLIIKNTKQSRSAAFLGYGMYKWRLGKSRAEAESYLTSIISTVLSSFTDVYTDNIFSIETNKQKYNLGETILLNAYIKNNGDIPDKVIANIRAGNFNKEIPFTRTAPGVFQCSTNLTESGDYRIVAEGIKNNSVIYTDSLKINCGNSHLEYKETKPSFDFLNRISAETGGTLIEDANRKTVFESINSRKNNAANDIKDLKTLYLRTNPVYLFILLFLFFIEWLIRKRLNLA